ncbi:hypothetical protein ACN22W_30085 [Burkholderia theae]|uniref:hypothetical protein n=1 Tax=Burkholderia theae TaxID=3143496 RepID=UPI003AFB795A
MTQHDLASRGRRAACIVWLVAWMVVAPGAKAAECATPAGGAWRQDTDLPDRSHTIRAAAAVVLTLAVGTVWLVSRKRRGQTAGLRWVRFASRMTRVGGGGNDGAVVRQSFRLGGAATMHVVAWGEREWLIGCSAAGLTVVAEQPARTAGGAVLAGEAQR